MRDLSMRCDSCLMDALAKVHYHPRDDCITFDKFLTLTFVSK